MAIRWSAVVVLLFLPGLAAGQALGDAARKEKERRDRAGRREAVPTITERELAASPGKFANIPPPEPEPPELVVLGVPAVVLTREQAEREQARSDSEAQAAKRADQERYWRARASAARASVEQAREQRDAMQRALRFGVKPRNDSSGRARVYSVHTLQQMANAADAQLAQAEAELERVQDEARRAGALPGWLR